MAKTKAANSTDETPPAKQIERAILTLRGQRVMLDADLAALYGVPTKRFNEQVKRNVRRFPEDFAFRLTESEKAEVVANCDHLAKLKFSPALPWAFTEHGAIMAANVLNSEAAIAASVTVVRAFVRLRQILATDDDLAERVRRSERRLDQHEGWIGEAFAEIERLRLPSPAAPPKPAIGFRAPKKGAEPHPPGAKPKARRKGGPI